MAHSLEPHLPLLLLQVLLLQRNLLELLLFACGLLSQLRHKRECFVKISHAAGIVWGWDVEMERRHRDGK